MHRCSPRSSSDHTRGSLTASLSAHGRLMRRLRRSPSAGLAASSRAAPGLSASRIVFLTPPTWKRLGDIPPGAENKDLARTRAIARWPARAGLFARKCDVDRAEACLIALAGLKRDADHD